VWPKHVGGILCIYYIMLCCVMLCYVVLCCVVLCYAILCCVIVYYIPLNSYVHLLVSSPYIPRGDENNKCIETFNTMLVCY